MERGIMHHRLVTSLAATVIVSAVLAACGGAAGDSPPASTDPMKMVIPTNVTKINGEVPIGVMSKSMSEVLLVDAQDGIGNETTVEKTTRKRGTRSVIHIHPWGGTTCVLEGEMTLYMDGSDPERAPAGTCYYMPPNHVMTALSSGTVDAVMLDSFKVPVGNPVWIVVEKGAESVQDQFPDGSTN